MKAKTLGLLAVGAVGCYLGLTSAALADSIVPGTYSTTIKPGETATIKKTVKVSAFSASSGKADVFFLSDTTGSMGGVIGSVRSNATKILNDASGLGDVAFGVGEYRDITDRLPVSGAYQLNQKVTTDLSAASSGINAWSASGGGDLPEANLFGLERSAKDAGWRSGTSRVMVWFGDAPGHDPRLGSTEASATAALKNNGIKVVGVNSGNLDSSGQASRITSATGGRLLSISSSPGDEVVDIIRDNLKTALTEYKEVGLDISMVPDGLKAGKSPIAFKGDFDRSSDREFEFEVDLEALKPGTYDFQIKALVDGAVVATELDSIVVAGSGGGGVDPGDVEVIPVPAAVYLFGTAIAALGAVGSRRRRQAATA